MLHSVPAAGIRWLDSVLGGHMQQPALAAADEAVAVAAADVIESRVSMAPAAAAPLRLQAPVGATLHDAPSISTSAFAAPHLPVRHSFEHGAGITSSSLGGDASCFGGGSTLTEAGQADVDASPFGQPDIDASPFEQPDVEASPFEQADLASLDSVALQQPVTSDCGMLRPIHSRYYGMKLPSSYPAAGRQTPEVAAAADEAGQLQEAPAGDWEEVEGMAREEPMVADLPW
jgi:hypothetical protein